MLPLVVKGCPCHWHVY